MKFNGGLESLSKLLNTVYLKDFSVVETISSGLHEHSQLITNTTGDDVAE